MMESTAEGRMMGTDTSAFQTALARVLTDPQAFACLYDDPARFAEENALSDAQIYALQSFDKKRLRWLSASLAAKRFYLVETYFPATFALLRRHRALSKVERSLIATYRPIKSERLIRSFRDAFWFAELIERHVAQGELDIPYLIDVVRCERAEFMLWSDAECVESAEEFKSRNASRPSVTEEELLDGAVRAGRHVALREFSCDVLSYVQALGDGKAPPEPEPAPTLLLFGRIAVTDRVQKARVGRMMKSFLTDAGAGKPTREILAEILEPETDRAARDAAERNCCRMLQKLYALNFVTIEESVGPSARGGDDDAGPRSAS
ncbi:hypothetical protein WMF04_30990 [Sorangium sp. So ce260]|uniref:hypothetical protein n=1 Tax=Sorangium sp. So ce260 TaxID=3133291 RepID=UPI003F62E52F